MTDIKISDFQLFKHDPKILNIGLTSKRITVYSQQIRATNLAALLVNKLKKSDLKIVIIGGGISGLTLTSNTLFYAKEVGKKTKLNHLKITLLEKSDTLLNIQQGCDTRWLHPSIYKWPYEEFQRSYTNLPYMNWKTDTASAVTLNLLDQFEKIASEAIPDVDLKVYTSSMVKIDNNLNIAYEGFFLKTLQTPPLDDNYRVFGAITEIDYIVLATGFSTEKTEPYINTPSYWRNDDLNQPGFGWSQLQNKNILISGAGDGGLIEVIRAILSYVRQDTMLEMLDLTNEKLIEKLKSNKKSDIFEILTDINDEDFNHVDSKLKKYRRSDINLTLTDRCSFKDIFKKGTQSILHLLIVYRMYKLKMFKYIDGSQKKITRSGEGFMVEFDHQSKFRFDIVYIRYGHSKKEVLKNILPEHFQGAIDSMQEESENQDITLIPSWTDMLYNTPNFINYDFINQHTKLLASHFNFRVNAATSKHLTSQIKFRCCINGLKYTHQKLYLIQLSEYLSNDSQWHDKLKNTGRTAGRILAIDQLMLIALCNKTTYIERPGFWFEKNEKDIHVINEVGIQKSPEAFMAVPIVNQNKDYVVCVVFIHFEIEELQSSTQHDQLLLDTIRDIYSACHSMCEEINKMIADKDIYVVDDYDISKVLENISTLKETFEIENSLGTKAFLQHTDTNQPQINAKTFDFELKKL